MNWIDLAQNRECGVLAGSRARGPVYARACVRACSHACPAFNAYAPYCDIICSPHGSTIFFDILSKTARFSGKEVTEHKMCVSIFPTTFL
jgi:hypothetical protein